MLRIPRGLRRYWVGCTTASSVLGASDRAPGKSADAAVVPGAEAFGTTSFSGAATTRVLVEGNAGGPRLHSGAAGSRDTYGVLAVTWRAANSNQSHLCRARMKDQRASRARTAQVDRNSSMFALIAAKQSGRVM